MRRVGSAWVIGAALLSLFAGSALCNRSGVNPGNGNFDIYVSPSVIFRSAPCPWITIHTDVPASSVVSCSVTVDGALTPVADLYADSLGNLVVKIPFEDIADLVCAPSATFAVVLNSSLEATDTVTVKN
jgi:hypothetical protein